MSVPSLTWKIIYFPILIIIDTILYLIPIFTLCIIPNFIITLIWYLPSICQLYSFIITEKEFDLRIRIYLFIFSPLIIVSYIQLCVIIFIGYGIFITLIYRLFLIFLRPEYPLYSLSLTAASICLIYQYFYNNSINPITINELLINSLLYEIFEQISQFIKNCWNFNKIKFSKKIQKIQKYKLFIIEFIFLKLIIFIDSITITLFLTFFIGPFIMIVAIIMIIINLFIGPIQITFDKFYFIFQKSSSLK